jgi:hypothetical protein
MNIIFLNPHFRAGGTPELLIPPHFLAENRLFFHHPVSKGQELASRHSSQRVCHGFANFDTHKPEF